MTNFTTKRLPVARDAVAPDGSDVWILLGLNGGGMAHFELAPGQTATAVTHRTVEEIWFFLSGRGEMWRKQGRGRNLFPSNPTAVSPAYWTLIFGSDYSATYLWPRLR